MGCVSKKQRIDYGIPEGDYQAYETASNSVMYISVKGVKQEKMLLQCVDKENNPESFYQPDRNHLPMRGGLAKKPRSLGSIKTDN